MAVFRCKMCGGDLDITEGATIATCEYCGTEQTLPKLDDDKRANMYDRANHFRRNNEFDKAMSVYDKILNEDNTDAEAYWSLVLCRYGIEYVEDPASHKRIPTVNRAQFTSIFDDEDYKSALEYADVLQKDIYEKEAHAINEIQKGILAISQKEEPFDVFICYKETDNNGRRTPDSVLAQDLYYQLKQEGFKVFFSRITLEDKLGSAYEPYIFAALNSAKVMVALGTRPEHFNAVWVKNEWSRYLALIKNGAKKTLIPAYRDMDPYDLPEEFSHLQAQDMSKLGFMQDLIRGIKKIAKADEPKTTVVKETVVSAAPAANIEPLLKRAFMFLEDGEWKKADELCEQVLNQDPENAQAYLGKLMADLKVRKQDDLKDCKEPFDDNSNYKKAVRFGDEKLKSAIVGLAEALRLEEEERNKTKAKRAKRNKTIASISIPTACVITIFLIVLNTIIIPNIKYNEALDLMNEGKYSEACSIFYELYGYKDSVSKTTETRNKAGKQAEELYLAGKVEEAAKLAESVGLPIAEAYKCVSNENYKQAIEQGLTHIVIPNGVTNIGDYTFYEYSSLTSITIPDSVTSIGERTFSHCSSLTSITIPDSVTSIGENAFSYCSSLTTITIPDSVTSIGDSAFSGCSSLTSITIPDSVTSIGDSAFSYCSSLTSITIPDSVTSIGEYAFHDCSKLTSITIPNSVTSIGDSAFHDCSKLTSITIPNSVTSIGDWAFCGCSSLTSITIPDSVTSIGSYAFLDCSNLTSITIPDSVTSIGSSAFYGCSSLRRINFNGTTAQWNAIDKYWWNKGISSYTVYCTDGNAYK